MAQDYDAPRNKPDDDDEVSALGQGDQNQSSEDDDENAIAENYTLPGDDLSKEEEDMSVTVVPMQGDEFVCSECFLVKHRTQLAYTNPDGSMVCKECAA